EMVYSAGSAPFRRPLIVGSELVAFSALLTARHAGIRPVALLEEGAALRATALGHGLARLLRVPVLLRTRLVAIHGGAMVEGVTVECDGTGRALGCDGVIFTGGFVPEAVLLRGQQRGKGNEFGADDQRATERRTTGGVH